MSIEIARYMWSTLPLFGVFPTSVEPMYFPHPGIRIRIDSKIYIDIPIGRHMSLCINGKKTKLTIFEKSMRKNTDLIKKALSKIKKDEPKPAMTYIFKA